MVQTGDNVAGRFLKEKGQDCVRQRAKSGCKQEARKAQSKSHVLPVAFSDGSRMRREQAREWGLVGGVVIRHCGSFLIAEGIMWDMRCDWVPNVI